jgi:hypothetical protein
VRGVGWSRLGKLVEELPIGCVGFDSVYAEEMK